jgi:hypothetical protein
MLDCLFEIPNLIPMQLYIFIMYGVNTSMRSGQYGERALLVKRSMGPVKGFAHRFLYSFNRTMRRLFLHGNMLGLTLHVAIIANV